MYKVIKYFPHTYTCIYSKSKFSPFILCIIIRWSAALLFLGDILMHNCITFSSPELKAQVSFSDHQSSVCPSICLSVNFSHFQLLLQKHWANFNQTWHKISPGEGDSSLFKWRATSFHICVKSLPFYSVLEDNYFSWLLNLSQVNVSNLMN